MGNKIRVLIVEDSFLMRKIIFDILSSDPAFEVVDKARNGKEALEKIFALRPDVVTLDVNLPVLDGLAVLQEIMQKQPTRVIMLSAYTQQGAAATITALEMGALDFIAKPSGEISLDLHQLRDAILSKVKLAAEVDWESFLVTLKLPVVPPPKVKPKPFEIKKLVVIGASTGGPRAILQIMQLIPADIPASFLIVQHMPEGFTLSFAERISWESGIKSKEAEDGDILLRGKAYVAPAGFHMVLDKIWDEEGNKLQIKLNQEPLVNFVRPSVSMTMNSAAEVFGSNVIGVILTGMGKDGLEGARRIKESGGFLIVQDKATSVVWGMPKVVIDEGLADSTLPLCDIPAEIIKKAGR